jgi:hypothetical protein
VIEGAAEAARGWTPAEGAFGGYFERVLEGAQAGFVEPPRRGGPALTEAVRNGHDARDGWRLVADCVPHRDRRPPPPDGPDHVGVRWVEPAWPSFARPVRFWLAGKAFASWLVLQGEGLRTVVLGLRVALGVLRAEAARGCGEARRPLDAGLLAEALRRADLLLLHLADPEALARRLGRGEA